MKTIIKQIMIALLVMISIEGFGQAPTITGFSPASGPVGTVVTITGTNLSSPTVFTIGGVVAIAVSNTGTTLVGMVMPGAASGAVSVTTAAGAATGSGSFTISSTSNPRNQQGPQLTGTGYSVGGLALSADGNTAAIGDYSDSSGTGAVMIFIRSGSTWSQQGPKLVGSGSHSPGVQGQGWCVALSADGNTVAIGSPTDSTVILAGNVYREEGGVWVFTRTGTVWTQQGQKLRGLDNTSPAYQGYSVALSADGNTLMVGGPSDSAGSLNYNEIFRGAAWVFTRSGGIWSQQGNKLVGTGGNMGYDGQSQGSSVALSADGNTALVGGRADNNGAGAVWVYTRSGGIWSQQGNKFVGTGISDTIAEFGVSASLSADGNTALIGGSADSFARGAVWVFTRTGNTWSQQGNKLVGTGGSNSAYQGYSVAISADGNRAIWGGPDDNNDSGSVWIFARSGSTWTQQGTKISGTGLTGGPVYQGTSVALSADGSTAIEGGDGAAWVFVDSALAFPAGPDQSICQYQGFTMAAIGTGVWSALTSNPQATTILDPASPTTFIIGTSGFVTTVGVYGFVWTTSSGVDTVYDTVLPKPNAGADQAAQIGGSATMAATGTGTWTSEPTNPGTSTITSPTDPTTTITGFSTAGTYMYYWTNSNGCDDTALVIISGPSSAGPDQNICINSTTQMNATGTGTWSALASNPSTTTITTASSPTTTISGFTVAGVYSFTWAGDTMTVTVSTHIFPSVNSPTICTGQSATLTATGAASYVWNTGAQTDSITVSSPVTETYTVTATEGTCTAIASGTVTVNPLPTPTVNSPTICEGQSATLTATGGVSYDWDSSQTTNPITVSPAGTTTYTVTATDINGCSASASGTVTVNLLPIPTVNSPTICAGDTATLIATGGLTYTWNTLETTSEIKVTTAGTYTVTATNISGCSATASGTVTVNNCASPDTVWPGDADANHVVDNNDLLTIGLGYDSTGPVRAVQGIVWQADTATLWQDYFTVYSPLVNFNNADCNGNGIINADDTLAIVTNFGDVHAKTNNLPGAWRSGIPLLGLDFSQDTTYNNDTLTTNILLGDSALPVNGIYGLAFTFNYDPLVVDSNYSRFYFIPSWVGDSTNSININRNFSTGQVKAAITRIDHTPRSGSGQLAVFRCIITTDNINGKDYSYYLNQQYISDITAIDQYGNRLSLNAGVDSNYVGWFVNGIKPVSKPVAINIYPNPAGDQVRITSGSAMSDIRIIDILGNEVLTIRSGNKLSETIDISMLAAGVYTVHVVSPNGTATAKLTVSR